MNQKLKNTLSKGPTVTIFGETVNYLVAYLIRKMTLKQAKYLQ